MLYEIFSAAGTADVDVVAAFKRYDDRRWGPASAVVLKNREMGPTKVLRIVEDATAGMDLKSKQAGAAAAAPLVPTHTPCTPSCTPQ